MSCSIACSKCVPHDAISNPWPSPGRSTQYPVADLQRWIDGRMKGSVRITRSLLTGRVGQLVEVNPLTIAIDPRGDDPETVEVGWGKTM